MMQSEQINELATALAKAQGGMESAVLNRIHPHFNSKYADLASVLDAVRGPLSAAGLSVVQTMDITDRGMVLRTTLLHSSGQYICTVYPLPAVSRPHEMGSALTYARRYSLSALICNAADEDDDASAAQASKATARAPEAASETITPEQAASLRKQCAEVYDGLEQALCNYLGVDSLDVLPVVELARAEKAIGKKRAAKNDND